MLPFLHAALHQSNDGDASAPSNHTELSVYRNQRVDRFGVIYANRLEWKQEARAMREYCARTLRGQRTTKRSSNCRNKQLVLGRVRRMKTSEQQKQLQANLDALDQAILQLEREQCLSDSARLTCRTNRACAAVDLAREYYKQFSRGYDATNSERADHYLVTRHFIESLMSPDVVCREYKGVQNFLNQWQCYTKYYDSLQVCQPQITLIDEDDQWISVKGAAEMRLIISPLTFEKLYPSFYEQTLRDPAAKALAEVLVGQRCVLEFDIVLHFNRHGQVFAHESKVHLATALLELLKDPIAAMEMLDASLMTEDGHWKLSEDGPVQESMYSLPKRIL